MALWPVQLLEAEGFDPRKLSYVQALHVLQRALIVLSYKPENLLMAVAQTQADDYQQVDRSGRNYLRKKHDEPPDLPLEDIQKTALRNT